MPIHNIPMEQLPQDQIGNLTELPTVEVPVDPEISRTFNVGDKVEVTIMGVVKSKTISEGEERCFCIEAEKVAVYLPEEAKNAFADLADDNDS